MRCITKERFVCKHGLGSVKSGDGDDVERSRPCTVLTLKHGRNVVWGLLVERFVDQNKNLKSNALSDR